MNVDLVLEASNEAEVKSIMNKSKIIVLWIIGVPGRPKSGQFFAQLQHEDKELMCCIAADTIEHACERCIIMWLPIISIQNKEWSLKKEESDNLIANYKWMYESKKVKEKEEKEAKKAAESKAIDNTRQEKIIEIISQTIDEITIITEKNKENTEFLSELRQLGEHKEQLTKMKMWSNMEKSTQILEQVFKIMEKIELASINQMKMQEEQITDYSVVSNIDIVGELDKLKRAKQTNAAGMKKNNSDIYYTIFWIVWLYQKFIAKDMMHKISKLQQIVTALIVETNIWLICISLIIVLYTILTSHLTGNIENGNLYALISLGIAWIIWNIPLLFRNQSTFISISSVILAIASIIIIQRLLLVNLALF